MSAALLAAAAVWMAMRPPGWLRATTRRRALGALGLLGAVVATVSILGAGAPVPALLVVVLAGTAWGGQRLWSMRARAAKAAQTQQRVLECCDLLASELAAGQPPVAALATAGSEWPALSTVAQTAAYGGDVPAAFRRASSEPGATELGLVAAAWQVSHRTGLGLADSLDRVAESLRAARATERVVRGELASARATARLVAGLPVAALTIGAGSGGDPFGFLVTTVPGVCCLAGGLALVLAGLAWIERIAAGVGR